jgi:hypothetical protein
MSIFPPPQTGIDVVLQPKKKLAANVFLSSLWYDLMSLDRSVLERRRPTIDSQLNFPSSTKARRKMVEHD